MKELRRGFTTGSCAAAASKAAAAMLFSGEVLSEISIETPAGEVFETKINYVNLSNGSNDGTEKFASCAVLKDGGDDPDATTGLYIYSRVSVEGKHNDDIMSTQSSDKNSEEVMSTSNRTQNAIETDSVMLTNPNHLQTQRPSTKDDIIIEIDGGEGIGRVTKPGLDRAVGEAAINSTPRAMIDEAVRSEAFKAGFKGTIKVLIYAPGGEEIALKTFNPRLGIEGGISILGTSGVENPMSMQAIIDTIEVEMKVHRAAGERHVAVTPGNYGQDYMLKTYGYDLDRSVKCSNFIGDALELAGKLGFEALLLTGHIGKLIKLSGGITNTHSSNGDCRMELLCASALRAGCDRQTCENILGCISTEEALRLIKQAGRLNEVMDDVLLRVMDTLKRRSDSDMRVECIIYSNDFGFLAASSGAAGLLEEIKKGV